MPRPRRYRRVGLLPTVDYFKPAGIMLRELTEVILTIGEFEAVRLKDYEGMEQTEAAKKMNISQSTFNRLLKDAREKIADAIVNGKAIRIQGGNYKMVQRSGGGMGAGMGRGAGRGRGLGRGGGRGRMGGSFAAGPGGICKCPKCNYEEPQVRGQPCMSKKCPKCNSLMTRA